MPVPKQLGEMSIAILNDLLIVREQDARVLFFKSFRIAILGKSDRDRDLTGYGN